MMNAIYDNIVLPPFYTIIEIKKTCKKKIGKSNKDITEEVIKNKLKILPYKKIICWCGTINKMKEWYIFFKNRFPELNLYCSTSKDKEHQNDNLNTNFDAFCDAEKNSILLCVNRCREGSDIKNLDCGIYLDFVKKRGILISIQTVGRILRPDKDKLKKCGHIIDTFVNDGKIEIEIMTAQRVISYYEKVLSLSDEENYTGMLEIYKNMRKICTNTEYDCDTNKIKIKLDDNKEHDTEIKLELTTKNFNWSKFTDKLEKIIDNKFDISQEDKFNMIIDKLKKTNVFTIENNFWEIYTNLDKKKLDLPENLYNEYKDYFDKTTWFELMGFDICKYYKTISKCRNVIHTQLNEFHNGIITDDIYYELKKHDDKLPPFPEEYFKHKSFTTIKKEFSLKKNKTNINFI